MCKRQVLVNKMTHTREDQKRQGGFTIIEVLIAISLLSVGLLAVASMQITAIRGNSSARRQTERTTWAQDKLEELMTRGYAHADLNMVGNPHQEANPPANYTITWVITDNTPAPNTKLITVSATGLGKTTQLTSVKAQF